MTSVQLTSDAKVIVGSISGRIRSARCTSETEPIQFHVLHPDIPASECMKIMPLAWNLEKLFLEFSLKKTEMQKVIENSAQNFEESFSFVGIH